MAKKVILLIHEGLSEHYAFLDLLNALSPHNVTFVNADGDITSDFIRSDKSCQEIIADYVKEAPKKDSQHTYKLEDIIAVVQIVDTDGVYTDNVKTLVYKKDTDRAIYEEDKIYHFNIPKFVETRNYKRQNMYDLMNTKSITVVEEEKSYTFQFRMFYSSCNLDHVLYDIRNLDENLKTRMARAFAKKFANDVDGFVKFIESLNKSCSGEYKKTFDYLRIGNNSLSRCTNLILLLDKIKNESFKFDE